MQSVTHISVFSEKYFGTCSMMLILLRSAAWQKFPSNNTIKCYKKPIKNCLWTLIWRIEAIIIVKKRQYLICLLKAFNTHDFSPLFRSGFFVLNFFRVCKYLYYFYTCSKQARSLTNSAWQSLSTILSVFLDIQVPYAKA